MMSEQLFTYASLCMFCVLIGVGVGFIGFVICEVGKLYFLCADDDEETSR